MLRKLSRRLTYANIVATLALIVAVGTGSAYAANTVFSTDIVDGEVKSVDIGNNEIGSGDVKDNSINTFDVHSFLGADVVDETLTGADIATGGVGSTEILNGSLNDQDVGQSFHRALAVNISTVNANSCLDRNVASLDSLSDHILLTPSIVDAHPALSYEARYDVDDDPLIHVCNPTNASINGGITRFNVLVFDAQ